STNKRKGENVITQNAQPTKTKLSRQARTRKNKKLRLARLKRTGWSIKKKARMTAPQVVMEKNSTEPECITDLSGRTLVYLEQLDDYNAVILVTNTGLYQKQLALFYKLQYCKLSWGLFAPKLFGVFPIIAINFNTTSDYHWDEHNEAN
ncbi:34134_t:CDS:2, partial [Racocetra persica]